MAESKKILLKSSAGDNLYPRVSIDNLVVDTLKPEGVWFSNLYGVTDRETAEYAVKRIARWK